MTNSITMGTITNISYGNVLARFADAIEDIYTKWLFSDGTVAS